MPVTCSLVLSRVDLEESGVWRALVRCQWSRRMGDHTIFSSALVWKSLRIASDMLMVGLGVGLDGVCAGVCC